jgi:hypothetical protein
LSLACRIPSFLPSFLGERRIEERRGEERRKDDGRRSLDFHAHRRVDSIV